MSSDIWALWPSVLGELSRGQAAAPLGPHEAAPRSNLDVADGVAVIELEGALHRGTGLLAAYYGGTNVDVAHRLFESAISDDRVKAILLSIDSPGGSIGGISEFASTVYAARGRKPVVAWTDGMMASAAYWIGSAAGTVYISGDTTMVGSIGVVTKHTDVSKAEQRVGLKTTEIYAGKYKTLGSPHAPLSDDDRGSLQAMVNHLYGSFVNAVAVHRGVSIQGVLDRMAEGRIFLGRSAIQAGLVDGVRTLDEAFGELRGSA